MKPKIYFSREEMFHLNRDRLLERGVSVASIAEIAYKQQSRYNDNVSMRTCVESVEKILSLRDIFHIVQLGIEIDRMTEEGKFRSPIQEIMMADLGMFGVDEVIGLAVASNYGTIGQTNFGDIDVNKPGIVRALNEAGKEGCVCHTFLDDIVGAIAASASTRVAQILSEEEAAKDPHFTNIKLDI